MGALAGSDGTVAWAVRGENRVWLKGLASKLFADSALSPRSWSLAADEAAAFGQPPKITLVELSAGQDEATLTLDALMVPDVEYDLTYPVMQGDPSGGTVALAGIRRSQVSPQERADGVLIDIGPPVIDQGERGGHYPLGAGGDRRLTGGLATLEKAIWHALLEDDSPFDHKGVRPLDLRDEERRLARVVEAVPYVDAAHVQIVFRDDVTTIAVTAQTALGELVARREIT